MPLYSDGVLDEVRNSVNIVSLISEYLALKKRGRNHVARCPFHTEKTPSFNVSEDKQIFHCFGCGVGGDLFKFVMQIEQLSFPEAVRFIAERYGIALPQPAVREEPSTGSDSETMRKAMEEAAAFLSPRAARNGRRAFAAGIFAGQGDKPGNHRSFQAGLFAGGRHCLLAHLQKKGFPDSCPGGVRLDQAFRGRRPPL